MTDSTHTTNRENRNEGCKRCGSTDTWFDRSICPCDPDDEFGGVMHTRCADCGCALDDCVFEVSGG